MVIIIQDDKSLIPLLRKSFTEFYLQKIKLEPIRIILPVNKWISANGLNHVLIYIMAIKYYLNYDKIELELFDMYEVNNSFNNPTRKGIEYLKAVYRKIIFYDVLDFLKNLNESLIIFSPSANMCSSLIDKIKNNIEVEENIKSHAISSKMLSLSPLVDSEIEQKNLTIRLKTLTNILHKNLFNRITNEKAEETSSQIMYELVKNLYQHAEIKQKVLQAQGYACAQINRYPTIQNTSYPMDLLASVLEMKKEKTKKRVWRILTISICDYGIGMAHKIGNALTEKLDLFHEEFKYGRYTVDRQFLLNDGLKMQLAFETNYSSKDVLDINELWSLKEDKTLKLSRKGHGLVYCLGFIAEAFGRIEIRSNAAILRIFAKSEAPLEQNIWEQVDSLPRVLEDKFEEYFDIEIIKLKNSEKYFPGTQILLEIPIEANY